MPALEYARLPGDVWVRRGFNLLANPHTDPSCLRDPADPRHFLAAVTDQHGMTHVAKGRTPEEAFNLLADRLGLPHLS